MTYVLGVRRFGVSAIITESLVTYLGTGHRDPASIKTGVLFSGCIFGITGGWLPAWRCIDAIRAACTQESLEARFDALVHTVQRHPYPIIPDDHFEILLSSRHSGAPRFYCIDSRKEELRELPGDLHALGSGTTRLDPVIESMAGVMGTEGHLDQIIRDYQAAGHAMERRDFPYIFAFLVYRGTIGVFGNLLAKDGAGGFVHFIAQDANAEWRQPPSLYLLTEYDSLGELCACLFQRVAFDYDDEYGDVLVSARAGTGGITEQWAVLIQNPDREFRTVENVQQRFGYIGDRQKKQPLYHVMVAGVANEGLHREHGATTPGTSDGVMLDIWSGEPQADLKGNVSTVLLDSLKRLYELMVGKRG